MKVRAPRIPVWGALACGTAAALVGLAAVVGTKADKNGTLDALPVVGTPVETTLQKPIVAGFLAAVLLVLLVGAVRGARLRWLATKPGAIDVADFTAETPLPDGLPRQLTLRFRERLSDLHLATPGPQPGVAPPTDFVQLIGSATKDSKNPLATAAGLMRVAWPAQAYQIQGSLITGEGAEGCGVTIQVVMIPSSASPPVTAWAASWPQAIDKAANHAAAFILPRTRRGRRPPWTGWHGYVMPVALLDCFERAAIRARHRRYDEALRDLYAALQRDPKNLDLRLRLGFVQEKLGLALDALATYESICRLGDRCRPTAAFAPSKGRAHVRTRRLAAYRSAVLLGAGERLVEQWCAGRSEANKRSEQLTSFRQRLRDPIEHLCQQRYAGTIAGAEGITLRALLDDCDDERSRLLLREVFQETALVTLAALHDGLAPWMPLADQTTLTRRAIKLSEACVRLRLEQTRTALGRPPRDAMSLDDEVRRAGLWLGAGDAAPQVVGGAAWSPVRALRRRRPTWGERYTAASLYALGITCGDSDEDEELAKRAIRQLEAAIAVSDSGYVASRRAWLTSEDPDLDRLRPVPQFRRFEATYFPSAQPTVQRPKRVHDWEAVQYVRRLLETCATQRAALWRDRFGSQEGGPSADRRAEWWQEELQAWKLVGEVAGNCQHWQTRVAFIDALIEWTTRHGWSDAPLAYPDYPDAPLVDDGETVEAAIAEARQQMAEVRTLAAQHRTRCEGAIGAAHPQLRPPGSGALVDSADIAELVTLRRLAWTELADLLAQSPPGRGDGGRDRSLAMG